MAFTLAQVLTIETIVRTFGALSILFSILILIHAFRKWSKISSTPNRMVIYWVIASLIPGPAMVIGRSAIPAAGQLPNALCLIQAVTIALGYVSSAMWAGVLSINIYLVVCRKWTSEAILRIEWIYHIIAWTIPLGVAVLPIIVRPWNQVPTFYGNAGLWCSVTDAFSPFRFISIGIAWSVFVIDILVYLAVGIKVSRHMIVNKRDNTMSSRTRFLVSMSAYVIAFIITYSGTSINRIATLVGFESYGLFVFQAITLPSVGIFAAMAYFGRHLLQLLGLIRKKASMSSTSRGAESNSTKTGPTNSTLTKGTYGTKDTRSRANSEAKQPLTSIESLHTLH